MEDASENKSIKHRKYLSLGLLAHVDAGKTTLSESILYLTGRIRRQGRVDHGDAFLDTYELERSRGITIFSKQAVFSLGGLNVTLLDTPGHVDFSAEMERTLEVLDAAVLVLSGADGVQGHTRTLWRLLAAYRIPVFLFVNKMDQEGTDRASLLKELGRSLDEGCVSFPALRDAPEEEKSAFYEELALCSEEAMEQYLETGKLEEAVIADMIAERKVFPCYFGAALKNAGVQELLDGIETYAGACTGEGSLRGRQNKQDRKVTEDWNEKSNGSDKKEKNEKKEGSDKRNSSEKKDRSDKNAGSSTEQFGARVFKISRDPQGSRLTHLKITNGCLRVKGILTDGEKVNQIRIYSGERYETVQEAEAGMVCAVTGLNGTYAGQGIGTEGEAKAPVLEPVLNYQIILPDGIDVHKMLSHLRQLEEEDPMLKIVWNEELGEIHARLMGEVQTEVLKSLIKERFGVSVEFGVGNIVYKETIRSAAEGVGHYEPLRHYAEVHLILEPGEPGSGLVFETACSEDELDKNWQRLILTHLTEKPHRGVLAGAVITDMKITLAAGRAHLKHTEGGDFRQATYRAVRQGLMQAESVLLEPYYTFRLEIPAEMTGRAMTDIQRMYGEADIPETAGEMTVLTGKAPVACMRDYQREVLGYAKGQGRLFLEFRDYEPCHDQEEVIGEIGYDPEKDTDNPAGSVFCGHGAGFYVPWNEVPKHMHIESQLKKWLEDEADGQEAQMPGRRGKGAARLPAGKEAAQMYSMSRKEEKELEEIFIRTYGRYETKPAPSPRIVSAESQKSHKKKEALKEYLLVDGYNVIFAWDNLKELARDNIEGARGKLMDVLCNYQGFKKCTVILVFDAYKVDGYALEIQRYHNIHVVYTKEAETADQYIEKVVHEIGRKYHVTVVTSDGVEQVVTLGQGGTLISAREFLEEVKLVRRQIEEEYGAREGSGKSYLFDGMDQELKREMEEVRLGKKELGEKKR